jgi:uncharacterized membrane protein YqhA
MAEPSEQKDLTHTRRQESAWERYFESFLWSSRLLVMLAVVPSLVGSVVLFLIGTMDILAVVVDTARYYTGARACSH